MSKLRLSALIAVAVLAGTATSAYAKPSGPMVFCETYPDSAFCASGNPPCQICHISTQPPAWNTFGTTVLMALPHEDLTDAEYRAALPAALQSLEAQDIDGDGWSNLEEITQGSLPADSSSKPGVDECQPSGSNPDYDVCYYDPAFAYRKVWLDFCGHSPTYGELTTFRAMSAEKQPAELERVLNLCLDSEFWIGKNGVLWKLAHPKIRPVGTLKKGEDAGTLPISDYYDDYHLFVYTQMDDHDARDVLLADYFVLREEVAASPPSRDGELAAIPGHTLYSVVRDKFDTQNMQIERRVGLLSTHWNLIYNVMFTALPRTAAAQAYRAFLGTDIARQQGLYPPATATLVDYDQKGITAPQCAVCHTTLDPLTYAFKNYNGLQGQIATYDPNRIESFFLSEGPLMSEMPEAGFLFGQPVADLLQWGQIAANSNQFAAAAVMDYWKLLMGYKAFGTEPEYQQLWQELMTTHDYSIERMLHDFIKTEAYGAP